LSVRRGGAGGAGADRRLLRSYLPRRAPGPPFRPHLRPQRGAAGQVRPGLTAQEYDRTGGFRASCFWFTRRRRGADIVYFVTRSPKLELTKPGADTIIVTSGKGKRGVRKARARRLHGWPRSH